ncbi:WD40 repeat-like protein [Suillus brevipes Sb2]|nr:WD40 repeat-like protein [Suillus brevipes Sb2]
MASPISKTKETPAMTHCQKFEGHTRSVWGAIHLPGGQRIITCSADGSLRVWNVKSGKQIGEDWRVDNSEVWNVKSGKQIGEDWSIEVWSIALSPDGKKVVSGGWDGAVRLWDIETCKVVTKWTGHTVGVECVRWSRDGRRVLSGSFDGTARQWEVESGETMPEPLENILASIKTHEEVYAVVYSPDTTLIATGGLDEYSIKILDAKTGKLVATLKGHTDTVRCLAWTKQGKTLISGSDDCSIRTWNTAKWQQAVVLDGHTNHVYGIAISPNDRILASVSQDKTARLWNLENGQPISSPIQHADRVNCVSFSAGGKRLATGCMDNNAYIWDVAAILREAGLEDLLSDPKAKKSALQVNATRPPIQVRPPVNRVPQGFFDGVPPSHSSARSHPRSSALPGSTFLSRLFRRSPSTAHDTSPSSPLDWARNHLRPRRQSGEQIELQGRSPAVVEVPYAKGKRRNASAGENRKRPLPWQKPAASSSRPPKPAQQSGTVTHTQPSLQPEPPASNSSTTPAVGDNAEAASSMPSRPDAVLRQAGLWTRFWLFIGCLSPEYQDGRH